jgi:NADH-quinone oxidoreductase subunit L
VAGGLLNWPAALGGGAAFEHWLEPIWAGGEEAPAHYGEAVEYGLMALSVAVAAAAIFAIYQLYRRNMKKTEEIAERAGFLYQASLNKYWVDEIYDALIVEPLKSFSYFFLFRVVDVNIVDGIANGLGSVTQKFAEAGKRLQTGQVQTYALYVVLGLLAIFTYFFGFR